MNTRRAVWRDAAAVVSVTLLAWLMATLFEFSEFLLSWTRGSEGWQADELPGVLLVAAAALVWFAWRRYREARREVSLRRAVEEKLAAALDDNRRLAQQTVLAQESERRRLAHELHDELGQYLNAIKIDAVAIRDPASGAPEPARAAAVSIMQCIDQMHGTVREMMRRLRPAALDELGLAAALEQCVAVWRQRHPDTRFDLRVRGSLDGLGEEVNVALYRIVQEGLTNAMRHARASGITVEVAREHGPRETVRLAIEDDGQGADLSRHGHGLGLIGMRERAEALGGGVSIASRPGHGFRLQVWMPVAARNEESE